MTITEILPLLLVAVIAANVGQVIYSYSLGGYLIVSDCWFYWSLLWNRDCAVIWVS